MVLPSWWHERDDSLDGEGLRPSCPPPPPDQEQGSWEHATIPRGGSTAAGAADPHPHPPPPLVPLGSG